MPIMQILLIAAEGEVNYFEIEGNLKFVGDPLYPDLSSKIELWDAIAAKSGVTLLSQFFSPPVDNSKEDKYQGPPIPQRFSPYLPDNGPWFSPEDGLRTVRAVLDYIEAMESRKIKGAGKSAQLYKQAIAARYHEDFRLLHSLLEGALAQSSTAKFRLTQQFATDR